MILTRSRIATLGAAATLLPLAGCSGEDDAASEPPPGAGSTFHASASGAFSVGAAVGDITPTQAELDTRRVYLGGYGILITRGEAEGVHDPIHARALAIESGNLGTVFCILDLVGASNRVIGAIRDGAARRTGLGADAIFVGSTHTHAAPDFQGLWGGIPAEYKQRAIETAIDAIVEAWQSRRPATLSVAEGEHEASNRRGWGFTDTELTVLDAHDEAGERIATLIDFAAHPVSLDSGNLLISRDFPGYTVDRAEELLGGTVLYFNGAQGDCSPTGGSGYPGAETYGKSIAEAAVSALDDATPVGEELTVALRRFEPEVTNNRFQVAYQIGFLDYDVQIDADGKLGLTTQLGYFRLGDEAEGVAWPGEALTRCGLPVKDAMDTPFRLFLGLTTDSLGYFVPSDEWKTGRNDDYEESVSMGESVGDSVQAMAVQMVAADGR
jgi:hypothetical protein